MQKHVNLVDLVKSFPTSIYLQNLASIQQRTSPSELEIELDYKHRNMNQDDESSITVQGGSPVVSSSGDEESVFSSTATEIDACLEEWVTTDTAKRLMEFLENALPRE